MASLLLGLTAAGVAPVASTAAARIAAGKVLVVYFSRTGNTRVIAGQVSRALRAKLFEIEPERLYPEDYFETVEQAKQECDRGYNPPLKTSITEIASYTTIFLGFPIWGTTAPPVIRSFLAAHDLSGKTIIPLITHGGYGLGDSLAVVAAGASDAHLVEGFVLERPQERQTIERITAWLDELTVAR